MKKSAIRKFSTTQQKKTDRPTADYLPIGLRVRREPCLVVGGGTVALRKIKTLLVYGADITCLSPQFNKGLTCLLREKRIACKKEHYSRNVPLKGYALVVAATNDKEVNRTIAERGKRERILVNSATERNRSPVIFPAVFKTRNISIAVSTQGRDPSLSKQMRDIIKRIIKNRPQNLPAI